MIAICGGGDAAEPVLAAAERCGRLIAEAGFGLVCGGRGGVMEAAARGARSAGGSAPCVVGILPGADAAGANPHCDVVLPTGLGVARNVLVVRAADVVILVGGGAGTLSEAALAWQLGKPLVALEASGGWAARLAGSAIDRRRQDTVLVARTPEEAVELAAAQLE